MVTDLKSKLTQENLVVFLFGITFWLYSFRTGVYSSVVVPTTLWGVYVICRHWTDVWQYFKQSYFIWLFGLIFIPMVISLISSHYLGESLQLIMHFLRFFFIGALAILLTQASLEKIRYMILAYMIVISIDAMIEWLTGYHLTGASLDRVRILGLFPYYHLGYVLATLIPVILFQTMNAFVNKTNKRYLWLILSLVSVVAIFVAGSRAGVITLVTGLGLLVLYMIVKKRISLTLISGVFLVVVLLGGIISQLPIVKNRYITSYQETEQIKIGSYEWFDKLSSARLVLWEFAWDQYKKNPIIGAGVHTFESSFNELPVEAKRQHTESRPPFPHFFGLEVLSETGMLGFICYLLVLGFILTMLLSGPQFSIWFAMSFLAMMPINMHVGLYTSFWAVLIWMPLILGLRERYLLMQKDPVNA